jgi:recombinational DNA repair ATPase RecF
MKITKITVKNFRSIEKVDNLNLNRFNVFIGQNNHGKTNFFEAIEWFFTPIGELLDIRFMRDPTKEINVEIEFSGFQKALNLITNDKQKKSLSEMFGTEDNITIKRSSTYENGDDRQLYNPKISTWENPLGRDTTWRQFLPTLEYVSTKKFLEDVAKYGKATPISKMLSAVMEKMLESDPQYSAFKKQFSELFGDPEDPSKKTQVRKSIDKIGGTVAVFLQKQFPDCVDVKFKVENPELEDLFKKFKTTIDDGIENDSSEKGDGMQRALMLAIIQAYANFRKTNGESKDFLFMIDEAELHLHPTAQRALKNALIEVSDAGDQVLVNTHSSVLVVDEHVNQTIYKVEKINKITRILPVIELEKPYVVYELLGGSPADLLLPRNFLVVEGKSDLEFITRVIRRHYPDKKEIQVIAADGDITQAQCSMNAIEQIFKPLERSIYKKKLILYLDKQTNRSVISSFLINHSYIQTNKQFVESSQESIEEYYPTTWKKANSDVKKMFGPDKIKLAKEAGDNITKSQFESEMNMLFEALTQCWTRAFD